jgi:hypothetical protein
MELMVVVMAFVLLDVAVLMWGGDTRDGKDWRRYAGIRPRRSQG